MTEIKKDKHVRKIDMASLWAEAMHSDDFRFEQKAQAVAIDLAKAVALKEISQAELACKLGWQASRVSKVLHGATNITLKTLFLITEALEMDFEVYIKDRNTDFHANSLDDHKMLLKCIMDMHDQSENILRQSKDCLNESKVILETAKNVNDRVWKNMAKTTKNNFKSPEIVYVEYEKFALCN
ncbi:hypothetical protein PAJ_0757 [Pantoea ananatis AJ13355]|uniref:HTH cro/C1-type domain-containing protein n=1 Tax=Pantoea ananatis (strain AJ13355) TaxID=932677 RepID=A0A0H3L238_PANAA|nr:helix-turn-helix transcriptional regulator [Pantoea ananatis]BAK10837.1 hypothetical protein PAJ_0757 [Pantoea ananatis AJ13355]